MNKTNYISDARSDVQDARAVYLVIRSAWIGRSGRPGVDGLELDVRAADRDLRQARRWFDSACRAVRADRGI